MRARETGVPVGNPLDRHCTKCGAEPGDQCVTPKGNTAWPMHFARRHGRDASTGAPLSVDMDKINELCELLREAVPIVTSFAAVGIPQTSMYRWLAQADVPGPNQHIYAEVRERITQARAAGTVKLVRALQTAALGGALIERTTRVTQNGDEIVGEKWAAPQPRAAEFLLERSYARDWARRQTVEITQGDGLLPESAANPDDGPADGVDRLLSNLMFFKQQKAIEAGESTDEVEVVAVEE